MSRTVVTMRLAKRAVVKYLRFPQWLIFRLCRDISPRQQAMTQGEQGQKEHLVQTVLAQHKGKTFLEIGIGFSPKVERLQLMRRLDIAYTGIDFAWVCQRHVDKLAYAREDTSVLEYLPNRVGTYAWTLFEMFQAGRQFDLIYVDGHHTFYVDLPAMILAHHLLKPGGLLLLDDILWTLDFCHGNMKQNFHSWAFYRDVYDFSQYTKEQRVKPHIKMIAEGLLIRQWRYTKVEEYSIPTWWVLQKAEE